MQLLPEMKIEIWIYTKSEKKDLISYLLWEIVVNAVGKCSIHTRVGEIQFKMTKMKHVWFPGIMRISF